MLNIFKLPIGCRSRKELERGFYFPKKKETCFLVFMHEKINATSICRVTVERMNNKKQSKVVFDLPFLIRKYGVSGTKSVPITTRSG